MVVTTCARWPSYGVMTPIWAGRMPPFRKCVTIFSTFVASAVSRHICEQRYNVLVMSSQVDVCSHTLQRHIVE